MKVILLQELKGKGGEGDVVDVANGYANNYLFPRKIAIAATKGNLKQLEQRKHNIEKRETVRLEDAGKAKTALEDIIVRVEAKVGEEGQLFGSVTALMIAESLKEQAGIEVDKKRIDLKTPIKTAGEHEVFVSLYRDVKSILRLVVGGPEQEAAAEEAEETEKISVEEVSSEESDQEEEAAEENSGE